MKNVDEECPLEGAKVIQKDVELPKEIPQVRSMWSVPSDRLTLSIDRESTRFLQMYIPKRVRGSSVLQPRCISDQDQLRILARVAVHMK